MAQAFQRGCLKHGISCEVQSTRTTNLRPAEIVWAYGMGEGRRIFDGYAGRAVRIMGDRGYWCDYLKPAKRHDRYLRISVNAQQPDAHLRLKPHPVERFQSFGVEVEPVHARGDYILLCGMGPKQAAMQGKVYGQWERETYARLRAMTDRPIFVREKPKNKVIDGIPRLDVVRSFDALRGAWAVVCNTGNIGADCLLHGVPVAANAGPGRVYYQQGIDGLATIEPLTQDARLAALADLSYWHWTYKEIGAGMLIENLKDEGVL